MPTYERIPIKLGDKDVAKMGRELADKRLEHSKMKDDKSDELKEYNAKLKTLDAEIETLAHSVQEHVRYEDVEVELVPDDGRFMMSIIRKDDQKLIRARDMTDDEKEESLARRKNPTLPGIVPSVNGKANGKGPTKLKANGKVNGKHADDAVVPDDYVPPGATKAGKPAKAKKSKSKGARA